MKKLVLILTTLAALASVPIKAAYDANVGRWMSRDPIGEQGGINLFGYVLNSPINRIDKIGLDVIFLNETQAAQGFGHAAVIVGSDADGWVYYSRDGVKNGISISTRLPFNKLENFDSSDSVEKYDRADYIKTTSDQDANMKEYGDANDNGRYSLLNRNCGDLAAGILSAGGIHMGGSIFGTSLPNQQFNSLVERHIGYPSDINGPIK